METDFDRELQSYFTDVEHLREMFKEWLAAPELPKRLLVIHGVGGVGKSSLLRMFRLHCKSVHVPVALASGDEQKSALDVLTRWADDLTADGVALPAFKKTLAQYRALYLKVENEAAKIAGKVTKEAAKTLVETAASTIPGFGPLVGKLGGMGVEALTDWLFSRGFKKPDVDLLLDPAKKLTEDFLADVTNAAGKQRLALMLDTFEQMEALSDWTRDVAQRLPPNVLLVIAGRAVPNWDRAWHGWMANAQVEELKPMTEEHMRELIRRYYATLRGGEPDPKQVEAIIAFARGLPMVVTSAVQLWVKYGVEDFQAVKPEIVVNLVDRLMEGVPKTLVPALEAAAIVRWFDQPILRAVMQRDDVREVYNELRRFPFVRTRAEGLALHDAVRDIIDENLRVQDAERHRELHERAAAYFEERLQIHERNGRILATSNDARKDLIELLYHHIMLDEERGFSLCHSLFDAYLRQYQLTLCDEILALLSSIAHHNESKKLWAEYFRIQLVQARSSWENGIPALEELLQKNLPSQLEIEIRWNLGFALDYAANRTRAIRELTRAYELSEESRVPDNTVKARILIRLGAIQFSAQGDPDDAFKNLQQALDYARKSGSRKLLIDALTELNYFYQRYGRFEDASSVLSEVVNLARQDEDEREEGLALARLGELYIVQGNFSEKARETLETARCLLYRVDDIQSWGWASRNLGFYFMVHRDFFVARNHFEASVDAYRKRQATRGLLRSMVALCECHLELGEFTEIAKLSPEIEDLEKRVVLHEWTSRWFLLKAHITWDGHILEWSKGFDTAIEFYRLALIYALRYNRFLLDEVLSGRPQGTPLRPIIPECLKRGEEGRKMLIALRDWWQTGINDVGTPRPDTISPIPEGIPLLEAERIAREREPGDGSPQRSVVEQIESALKEMGAG